MQVSSFHACPFSVDCMTLGDSFSLWGFGFFVCRVRWGFQACLAPQSPQRHLLLSLPPSAPSTSKDWPGWKLSAKGSAEGTSLLLPGHTI